MKKAIEALKAFVHKTLELKTPDYVTVYTWKDKHGLRISEISTIRMTGRCLAGCSWMRSDFDAGNVILAAEDFLLTFGEKPGENGIDMAQECREKLAYALGKPKRRNKS